MCKYCDLDKVGHVGYPLPMGHNSADQVCIQKEEDGYVIKCTIEIKAEDKWHSAEFDTQANINFCPMCARDLRKG